MRGILDDAKIQDLESVGAAFTQLMADIDAARTAKNWTAVAALSRIKLQMQGFLKETIVLAPEQMLTDEQLIERVTKGDTRLAALLLASVGREDAYRQ